MLALYDRAARFATPFGLASRDAWPAEFEQLVMEELPKRQTLLHCLRDEQEQLVRPLLAIGIDINAVDTDGNSAMHTAASGGHAAVVRMLIMCNAEPHIVNKRDQDALLCAVRSKHNTMVRPSAGFFGVFVCLAASRGAGCDVVWIALRDLI